MKNDLMIKKFRKEFIRGTMNMMEIRSFFGSKLMDIEDTIVVDNSSIQYTQLTDVNNYGYQYMDPMLASTEENFIVNLTDIKGQYHTIKPLNQNIYDLQYNTKWYITIDTRNILRDYLFLRIKEARSFKSVKSADTLKGDVNLAIYEYIDYNIIDRYQFENIYLYVKYENLVSDSKVVKNATIQYSPVFNDDIIDESTLVKDYNLKKSDALENLKPIIILYSQTKKSSEYRFDYYFNIYFEKI